MPISDDAQILQVPLKAQGAKSDDWSSVRVNDLTQLNAVLRQIQEQVNKLTGRTGDSAIRSGLSVAGAVNAGGTVSGSDLTLGGGTITPSDPSFAPLVEATLTPRALDYAPMLGAKANLLTASPFTWTLSEHFIGGVAVSGSVGELGWSTVGVVTVGSSEANHPGIVNLNNTASLTLVAQPVAQSDLSYIGMVVRPNANFRTSVRLGFITVGAGTDTGNGAYFYYDSATPTWETVTRSAAGFTRNDSGLTVVNAEWVLLEIVLTATAVDFYFNRTRMFRHQDASVAPTVTVGNLGFEQENTASIPDVDYDRFIVAGRGTNKIWT